MVSSIFDPMELTSPIIGKTLAIIKGKTFNPRNLKKESRVGRKIAERLNQSMELMEKFSFEVAIISCTKVDRF